MRIGVLTAGGDCPGLNAVIRSVVHRAVTQYDDEVIGFEDGYRGLLDRHYRALDLDAVGGILALGGTILGSSRWSGTGCGRPASGPPTWSGSSASTR